MRKLILQWLYVTALASFLLGCTRESSEFALPQGNIAEGKKAFVQYQCNDCHSIADIKHSGAKVATEHMGKPSATQVLVALGGKTTRFRSQAELVTAVINPEHKISSAYARHFATKRSPMRTYNEVMTVQDLLNLIEFLQTEYDVTPPRLMYYDTRKQADTDSAG